MIDELHTLMNFLPVSSNQVAVGSLLDHVQTRLQQCGLEVERLEYSGYQSLYASTRGKKHSKVMLQSHVDVVPGGEVYRQEGDNIYGRGCYDMLFAVASYIHLIDNLDPATGYDISLLLTGDEELGGANGVGAALNIEQYTTDVCILPDAGEGIATLSIAAKGMLGMRLKARGLSHHGSRPWEGDAATHKLVLFLTELQEIFDTTDQNNATITISQLAAGNEALNQGPAEATAGIDIRFNDEHEYDLIRGKLTALAKRYDVETLEENLGRSFALDVDTPLVKQFIAVHEAEIGQPIEYVKAHGSSDARYFDDRDIPVIMLRPNGGNAHGDGEWLSVESWQTFHQIVERYVREVAKV